VGDEPVPDKEHDQRTDGRGDETGPLVEPIPTDGLADKSGEERTRDPEQRGEDD
jgi:hypothetical protein